ncbi:TonB-dependent receptor domain-containing protein [Flavobacteriaceae bacterium M23B6Z8]
MKLKAFNVLLFLIFAGNMVLGQELYTFSGKVTDLENRLQPNVEIYLTQLGKSTTTNQQGVFTFDKVPKGNYTLVAFKFEFKTFEQVVTIDADISDYQIRLQPLGENLNEVTIYNRREEIFALRRLKQVESTAIFAGKKNEVVLIDNITGNLAANNPRQVYNQVVGLNIYENGDAGLQLNIGGRGLNPNRSANFNTRQNGYDISADVLGYPESYYTPTAEALREIQVIRGAASLQYGTQFGGLVNFVFKKPNSEKSIDIVSRQTLGSFNLFTSFNSVSGTKGKFSYYTFFNYKEGDGFRPNSGFNSRNYFAHLGYQLSDKTKIKAEFTLLNYLAQQAGGLTDAQFYADPNFSNRERNWFEVDWKLYNLSFEHEFSAFSTFTTQIFGLNASRRALGFRTNRVSQEDDPSNARELLVDNFKNWGIESRFLSRYNVKDRTNVFLIGAKFYKTNNDQRQGPGPSGSRPDFRFATDEFPNFERQAQFELPNQNIAVFGEHIFDLSDKLKITPGVRFENIVTESDGSFRNIVLDLAGNPILNEEIEDNRKLDRSLLLLGLGAQYKIKPGVELYGNISQNYRSVTFNDIRVVNPSFQIDENIEDEKGFTTDVGLRGTYRKFISFDTNLFLLYYDGRLGEVLKEETRPNALGEEVGTGRIIRFRDNIGTALMYGLESFVDISFKSIFFPDQKDLKLSLFSNIAITGSEYLSSEENNVEGNKVEFIPDINLKTGINFGYKNFLGSFQYAYLSQQFTDATNAPQDRNDNQRGIEGAIPAYGVADLSFSYSYKFLRLEAGINNVFDEIYFTRRATGYPGPGIIPAEPRSFYTTLQINF